MNPEHEKDDANKGNDAKIKVDDLPLEKAQGDAVDGGIDQIRWFYGPASPLR